MEYIITGLCFIALIFIGFLIHSCIGWGKELDEIERIFTNDDIFLFGQQRHIKPKKEKIMGVIFNPNCKYYDRGFCNHLKMKGWFGRKLCVLPDKECSLQEKYPRPTYRPKPMSLKGGSK